MNSAEESLARTNAKSKGEKPSCRKSSYWNWKGEKSGRKSGPFLPILAKPAF